MKAAAPLYGPAPNPSFLLLSGRVRPHLPPNRGGFTRRMVPGLCLSLLRAGDGKAVAPQWSVWGDVLIVSTAAQGVPPYLGGHRMGC